MEDCKSQLRKAKEELVIAQLKLSEFNFKNQLDEQSLLPSDLDNSFSQASIDFKDKLIQRHKLEESVWKLTNHSLTVENELLSRELEIVKK